ncbi:MAG: TonB-dependent receptor plug domain-containing protein [Flavobacteriales bacterium]
MLQNKLFFLLVFTAIFALAQAQIDPDTTLLPQIDSLMGPGARLPIYSTTAGDLDADLGSQDISGLLQSSRDVYAAAAGFNFGSARFRIRGLGSENSVVMINGVRVNDLETGWASWSNWGGLNDVTRWMEIDPRLAASRYTFGGVGGQSLINVRASNLRKGNRVSYAYSNRSYNHRLMATGNTGVMDNGVAVSTSFSRRYANEGYVEGTFFDAWSYFLSVEKKFNEKHSLGFVGFGAPMRQGRQALAIQEAYNITGNNYYNPNWGYQNGEKRNARISERHNPMMMLTHYFTPGEKTKLHSSVFFSPSRSGLTGINWYDAKDPRPDYYRYLPSYFEESNPAMYQQLINAWQTDPSVSQIDWDQLYFANGKNLFTVQDEGGVAGNSLTGNRSKYILENNHNDVNLMGANVNYLHQLNDKVFFSAGLNHSYHRGRNYKTVHDLLGGDFWLDIDNFAQFDLNDPEVAQNDIDNPNKAIYEGDVFGYDYYLNIHRSEAFGQVEYALKKLDLYATLMLSNTSFWREGNMRNGRFPDNSVGKSEVMQFFNYGIKAGATYKVTGRHYINSNLAYLTRAPLPRNSFVSPRTRDVVVSNLQSEEVISGDINYIVRYPKFRSRASLYYTQINNMTTLRNFYHDEYRTIVNYTMTGVNQLMTGVELGAEASLTSTIVVTAVLGKGQYVYNSRPSATITRDNLSEVIAEDRTVYLKNYRLGGMPQTAASMGLKYNSPKYWFVGVNANYFADIYLEPNADRRTEEAVQNLVVTDPQWNAALEQTKFDNQFTLDLYGGKSWKIKDKFLNLNLSVNNILNNQSFVTGGFEQLRYNIADLDRFPPRLSYHFGTTFFAMLSLRF